MSFENFEQKSLEHNTESAFQKLDSLHSAFEGSVESAGKFFGGFDASTLKNVALWLNIENMQFNPEIHKDIAEITKTMLDGGKDTNGNSTWGLKTISDKFNIHRDYADINTKQQAGFCAEIVSTAKENMLSKLKGTGEVTYRADDRPDLFHRNDQFVDKIRVDADGNVIERIQTKFVGSDGKSCWDKLKSKDFEKYLDDSKVDKIEIPKDYYDEIKSKNIIGEEKASLRRQIDRLKADGKTDIAEQKTRQLEKIEHLERKLERSNTTQSEALEARKNPEAYAKKIFKQETLIDSHKKGLDNAAVAAGITFTISTVDNVQKYMNGEITAKEAFVDVAKDTGKAGAIGYGMAFITTSVTAVMSQSSHELVKSLAGAGVPGIVVSYGLDVYDSVIDFAQGNIDGKQLAYDLGEGGAHVGGSILGSAAAGAVVGSVVPGAGTVVGFGAGLVGGMIGCAVASEAYATAVEHGSVGAALLGTKASEIAHNTYELAKNEIPTGAEDVRNALNNYAASFNLPFHL